MILTFGIVLVFTMFKEAYEDILRYGQDREYNNRKTHVFDYDSKYFVPRRWADLRVGDLVRVSAISLTFTDGEEHRISGRHASNFITQRRRFRGHNEP